MKPYTQGQLDFCCGIYAVINALKLIYGIRLGEARKILAESLYEFSLKPELWTNFLLNRTDGVWLVEYLLARYCSEGKRRLLVYRIASDGKKVSHAAMQAERRLRLAGEGIVETGSPRMYRSMENELFSAATHLDDSTVFSAATQSLEFEEDMPTTLAASELLDSVWQSLHGWLPERGLMSCFEPDRLLERAAILRFHRYLPYQDAPLISHWSVARDFSRETLNLFDCTADRSAVHSLAKKDCVVGHRAVTAQRPLRIEPESIYLLERGA